jgi:hypothetical protein
VPWEDEDYDEAEAADFDELIRREMEKLEAEDDENEDEDEEEDEYDDEICKSHPSSVGGSE